MSDQPGVTCTSCRKATGGNLQQSARGLSVQGRTGDVYYYAACEHHHPAAASTPRRTVGFSPVAHESLREKLHQISRVCARILDDLRDDIDDDSGDSRWD